MPRLGTVAIAIWILSAPAVAYGQMPAIDLIARHVGDLSKWRQHLIDDAAYVKGLPQVAEETRALAVIYYNSARSSVNGLLDQMIADIETEYATTNPQEYKTKTLEIEGAANAFHSLVEEAASKFGRKEDAFVGCVVAAIGVASGFITIYQFASDVLVDSEREQMIEELKLLKLPGYHEINPARHLQVKSASLVERSLLPPQGVKVLMNQFYDIGGMVAVSFDGEMTAFPVIDGRYAAANIYRRGEEPSITDSEQRILGRELIQISVFQQNPTCIRIETEDEVMDVCR